MLQLMHQLVQEVAQVRKAFQRNRQQTDNNGEFFERVHIQLYAINVNLLYQQMVIKPLRQVCSYLKPNDRCIRL